MTDCDQKLPTEEHESTFRRWVNEQYAECGLFMTFPLTFRPLLPTNYTPPTKRKFWD